MKTAKANLGVKANETTRNQHQIKMKMKAVEVDAVPPEHSSTERVENEIETTPTAIKVHSIPPEHSSLVRVEVDQKTQKQAEIKTSKTTADNVNAGQGDELMQKQDKINTTTMMTASAAKGNKTTPKQREIKTTPMAVKGPESTQKQSEIETTMTTTTTAIKVNAGHATRETTEYPHITHFVNQALVLALCRRVDDAAAPRQANHSLACARGCPIAAADLKGRGSSGDIVRACVRA
ncbi:hypothetical protein IWX47DRAFT_900727 [Phyllosticta citricarpa]